MDSMSFVKLAARPRSFLLAAVLSAVAVSAATNQQLVATLELAPFKEVSKAATSLGTMINQPLMPAMTLNMAQQGLVNSYGKMRTGSPLVWQVYLDPKLMAKFAMESSKNPFEKAGGDIVLLYPIAGGEAAFMQSHVGSTKGADGTIKLLAGGTRANETFAKFTADGKYCAFAATSALAIRAAEAFATPSKKHHSGSLVRTTINKKGIDVIAALLKRVNGQRQEKIQKALADEEIDDVLVKTLSSIQQKQFMEKIQKLRSCGRITMNLDFDDRGLAISGGVSLRKGAKPFLPPGTHLAKSALDEMPGGIGLVCIYNMLSQCSGEEFKESCAAMRDLLKAVRVQIKKCDDKDFAKYRQSVDDVIVAIDNMYSSYAEYTIGKDDWSLLSIMFDADKRPSLFTKGEVNQTDAQAAAFGVFLDRLVAIMERQWPGNGFIRKIGEGAYTFDWLNLAKLIDKEFTDGSEKDPKKRKKESEESIAEAKKVFEVILGGTASSLKCKSQRKRFDMTLSTLGVPVPTCPAGYGAKRLFAALPEVDKDATLGGFYLTPYAFTRDVLLPGMIKLADKDEAKEYQTLAAALPSAAPGGALAAASWLMPNGSIRFAIRLTADEIKCIGAACNAVTAAAVSSSSTLDDDDDDD